MDTSDHEVNIKILTSALEAQGRITRPERNTLLLTMTEGGGRPRLFQHNHDQTPALSLLEQLGGDARARPPRPHFIAELVAAAASTGRWRARRARLRSPS